MAAARTKKRTAAAADRLINRELSFLDYDARVLALAEDGGLPLLERVRFCSIFSAMLDEFFSAIRDDREPECSARDNLKSLAMVFAAIQSATWRRLGVSRQPTTSLPPVL